jgi:hypothetical protein
MTMMPRRRARSRSRTRRHRRPLSLADRLTTLVIMLQLAVLLTFLVTPTSLPPRMTLFELLWAWSRRPTFYPLVALLMAGPVLTVLAWTQRGLHRPILAASWVIFTYFAITVYGDRLALMLRLLWRQM